MRLIDVYPYRSRAGKNEFLILRRSSHKKYAGQWRMIGGKIKKDEMAWEAGLRELNEETKANPVLYWVIPSINHFYNHQNDNIELIPAFAAELDYHSEIILNEEHSEFKWIEYQYCNDFIQWPEQLRLLSLTNTLLNSQQILEDWKITF